MLVRLNDYSNYSRKPVTTIFDLHAAQWHLEDKSGDIGRKGTTNVPEMKASSLARALLIALPATFVATVSPAFPTAAGGLVSTLTSSSSLTVGDLTIGEPSLLKDIETTPSSSATSEQMAEMGGEVYFSANDGTGWELWATDGSDAGTRLVKDVNPNGSSSPRSIIAVGSQVFFVADDGTHGRELWVTDGTELGTAIVADIKEGSSSSNAQWLTESGGLLFLAADDGIHGQELWVSDGTPSGTQMVFDLHPSGGTVREIYPFQGSEVLVSTTDGTTGVELWRADGGSISQVLDINSGSNASFPSSFLEVSGGQVYFTARDATEGYELWVTDGTPGGTQMAASMRAGSDASWPRNLSEFAGEVYFSANDGSSGYELWKFDGANATLIEDLNPGSVNGQPSNFTEFGGHLYFTARVGTESVLWRTDGTTTEKISDVLSLSTSLTVDDITLVGGYLYFGSAYDSLIGEELYRFDGTSLELVSDIASERSSEPERVTAVGSAGSFVFSAEKNEGNRVMWASDGTDEGTLELQTISSATESSSSDQLTAFGDLALVVAETADSGRELWATDGTASGTTLLKDIYVGEEGSEPREIVVVEDLAYFSADDGVHGRELWVTDGTSEGTRLVADVFSGATSSRLRHLAHFNGLLYFFGDNGSVGYELMVSDGTAAGTRVVVDYSTSGDGAVSQLVSSGSLLFYICDSASSGIEELCVSDGTTAGTTRVGSSITFPTSLTPFNSGLLFGFKTSGGDGEVWFSDGSEDGTRLIKQVIGSSLDGPQGFVTFGDGLAAFFDDSYGELWVTDGSEDGTLQLTSGGDSPFDLVAAGNSIIFTQPYDGANRIWVSDGTETGTTLLSTAVQEVGNYRFIDGYTFFSGHGGDIEGTLTDQEFWVTDGTSDGTMNVADINPYGPSGPEHFIRLNDQLLFTADHGQYGNEVWVAAISLPEQGSDGSFIALTPARIMDTRSGDKVGELDGSGDVYSLQVTGVGGVPSTGVSAVALNVTAVSTETNDFGGFVTVFPCGERPDASNLNFTSGQTIPNSVIAPVSGDGEVCFYVYGKAHLLTDVSGYFPR